MAPLHDKRTGSKALTAGGALLLAAALLWMVWGIGRLEWLGGIVSALQVVYVYVAPVVLFALIVYVVWAGMHGAFAGAHLGGRPAQPLACDLDDRRIAGLCGGIAAHYGVDSVVVRVVALGLFVLLPPVACIVYLTASLVLYPR